MPSVSVIYTWLRQYTSFQDDYSRARDIRSDKLGNEIIEIADTEEDPQKARNMIDARKWVASRMTPKKWGDRVEVEHSGSVQGMGAVCINILPAQAAPVLAACAPALDVQAEKQALPNVDSVPDSALTNKDK